MKILITAIGKRVQLIKHLKSKFDIVGIDSGDMPPAKYFVDKFYKVSACFEESYIEEIVEICKKEKVAMLIPLYEKEFTLLNLNRHIFKSIGTELLLSEEKVISICNNKLNTYKFFKDKHINTPETFSKGDMEDILKHKGNITYPLIIKPLDGMGSQGVYKINSKKQLEFFMDYVTNPIVQQFIEGKEYTVDVLCDLEGNIISAVPRERLEVRAGEVTKTKTCKNNEIIKEVINLCSKIKFIGPATIQCIVTKENKIKFIEINARFGGGVPLTFECGVNYAEMLERMLQGKRINPILYEFEEKTMLRYDEAVIL